MTKRTKSNFIIIGSGITGLCLGALLAKKGYSVLQLEQHPSLLGGHARTLNIQGLPFCCGPQYVWNFIDEHSIGQRTLKYLDLEKQVPFRPLDSKCFERYYFEDDSPFDVPMGLDHYQSALIQRFTENQASIKKLFYFLHLLFKASQTIANQGLYLKSWADMRNRLFFDRDFTIKEKYQLNKISSWSLHELFEFCQIPNPVRTLMYSNSGIFAENMDNISAGLYATALGYYHQDASYPVNGFKSLIDHLSNVIVQEHGEIRLGHKVNKILTKENQITGIVTNQDQLYSTHHLISSISPRLLNTCFDNTQQIPINNYQPSNTLMTCFLGVKPNAHILDALNNRLLWWSSSSTNNIDYLYVDLFQPPSTLFVGSTYLHTPNLTLETIPITVFLPGNFQQCQTIHSQGPTAYQDLKKTIKKNVISTLSKHIFPNLADHVVFMEILTPTEIFLETSSELGSVYGRRLTANSILKEVTPVSKYQNLTFACATVGLPGIATAFQTAAVLFEELTGDVI